MGYGRDGRLVWFVRNHGRFALSLSAVLFLLVVLCVGRTYGPASSGLMLGPVAAAVLIAFSRRRGLTWSDLGLSRHTWARGAVYAVVAVAVVAAVYAVAAMVPLTRAAFADVRYELPAPKALFTAFVAIPVGTVAVEEIAFRGVLLGLVTRHRGHRWGFALSSVAFGAWHILPSLGLNQANAAMHAVAGAGDRWADRQRPGGRGVHISGRRVAGRVAPAEREHPGRGRTSLGGQRSRRAPRRDPVRGRRLMIPTLPAAG
jgi:membrane protease YdiL (CAAX protease family)